MKRRVIAIGVLVLGYLATGLYIVKGNEQAVVRQFGQVQRSDSGAVRLQGSGLHYAMPWPFAIVDRVNFNELHTLTIGLKELDDAEFLTGLATQHQAEFLTGDKNILNLQLGVQYRISEVEVDAFLFANEDPIGQLQRIVEATATDLISRSGVDFVHPLGLAELRNLLTTETRDAVASHQLGLEIEEVTIHTVQPPLRVKADFLDVSNARADQQQYINAANAYAQQKESLAAAEARQLIDLAKSFQQRTVAEAESQAASFEKLIDQLANSDTVPYRSARELALQRRYLSVMQQLFSQMKLKVVVDGETPGNVLIAPEGN